MDGYSLTYELAKILRESTTTSLIWDDRTSYDYLYEAACELTRRTNSLTSTQTITTVASTSEYLLNADYLCLYLRNKEDENQFYIKYNDGTNDWFINWRDYSAIIHGNLTSTQAIPDSFTVTDYQTMTAPITGTATSSGASSNGECTLTDSTAPFTNASVGDEVHNTTDGSHGIVISKTSTSALVTCMFGGTNNEWTSADAYLVVPQGRMILKLNPPPSTSGHTITFYYLQRPTPVYSPYKNYRFNSSFKPALVCYAAWKYKYRDDTPNYGDAWYKYFEMECRKANQTMNRAAVRETWGVTFKKRSYRDRSYR
jgi:hypothetical protein